MSFAPIVKSSLRGMRVATIGAGFSRFLSLGLLCLAHLSLVWSRTTMRPVLFTTYAAFILGGASYYLFIRQHFRKLTRADRWRGKPWNWSFDKTGVRYSCVTTDVRLAWSALDAVEDLGTAVFFRMGWHALCIPSRVFGDNAARASFVAAASARIKAAAEGS
jgi:hypothetical protein